MYTHSRLHILWAVLLCVACSSGGPAPANDPARTGENGADIDQIYARRFALEEFETRLDSAKNFYASGNQYLFVSTRDSLVGDVNAYIRANPHSEDDPEFRRVLDHLAILDTLGTGSVPIEDVDTYAAEDDSLALTYADWPEIDFELDDGKIFSEFSTVFPEIEHKRIDFWIKYFTGPGRARFERAVHRMQMYRPTVEAILDEKDMPQELICIALIESGYSMKAVSYASAVGPWQFIAGTGKRYGLRMNWWYDERRDIVASTYAACNYLSDLHDIWGDWYLAFAAYNCGEYRVARQVARQKTENFWNLRLPRQTQRYVPKFLATLYILRNPEKYEFEIPYVEAFEFDEVTVTNATDLKVIAECAGTSVNTIMTLNPQCKRWSTPPNMEVVIKVPAGSGVVAQEKLNQIPPEERVTYQRHRVRKGQTLSQISQEYGTSVAAIKQLNGLRSSHMIREGKYLLVPMKGATAVAASSSKPRYKESSGGVNKQALENYAKKAAPPKGYDRITYTVKDNDTLGQIAEDYKTSARKIRAWNNLSYRRYIHPGQKLAIYVPEGTMPAQKVSSVEMPDESCCVKNTYTVKKGDTFYSISKSHSVSVSELLAWNNKSRRSIIRPGDRLHIWKRK